MNDVNKKIKSKNRMNAAIKQNSCKPPGIPLHKNESYCNELTG